MEQRAVVLLSQNEQSRQAFAEGLSAELRTDSAKVAIYTISGFFVATIRAIRSGSETRRTKGLRPKPVGLFFPQKSIREQALAARSSGVSHGRDEVRPDFHGSTGELVGRDQCRGSALAFPMTVKVIQPG